MLRSGAAGLALHPADMLLLGAMLCAVVGYGFGARLSQHMRAEFVICWALMISLPVTAPLAVSPTATGTVGTTARLAANATYPPSPGAGLPMYRFSRCGWAFLPGTGAWRWAERCA